MSVQYLSVIINKIPEFLNSLSLGDICNLRETCNSLKVEIDKKLTIDTSDPKYDITIVSCQNHFYRKKVMRGGIARSRLLRIIDPFVDDVSMFMNGCYLLREDRSSEVDIIIIEHNNDRTVHSKMILDANGRTAIVTDNIKKIRDDYYRGINISNYIRTKHYIRVKTDRIGRSNVVITVTEITEKNILLATSEYTGDVIYHLDSGLFNDQRDNIIEEDYNCIQQNAIRMVLEMN